MRLEGGGRREGRRGGGEGGGKSGRNRPRHDARLPALQEDTGDRVLWRDYVYPSRRTAVSFKQCIKNVCSRNN